MSRQDLEAKPGGQLGGLPKPFQFVGGIRFPRQVGIVVGVQLHGIRFQSGSHLDLVHLGFQEEAHPDIRSVQFPDHLAQVRLQEDGIDPTLHCQLFARFRHEGHPLRPDGDDAAQGFRSRRAFHVQRYGEHLPQDAHIPFLDMPAVAPEMHRDAMRTCALGDQGRGNGLRFMAQPDLPERRNVIDVHAKAGGHHRAPRERSVQKQATTKD